MSLTQTLDALLSKACEGGKIPGVVATAATDKDVIYQGAAGVHTAGETAPMTTDTIALFASMTKAVTGAAAMQLVEQGKLSLDEPAGKICPYLGKVQVLDGFDAEGKAQLRPPKGVVTLRNLMTHTAGFGYEIWNPNSQKELESRGADTVFSGSTETLERPLVNDPGSRWEYGINTDWIGRMVEEASGETLQDYFKKNILGPLGMNRTSFRLDEEQKKELAGMHARTPDGQIVNYPLIVGQDAQYEMGGHGLYGPLTEYLRFTRMILGGGALDGVRILEEKTVKLMSENHMGDLDVTPMPDAQPFSNAVDLYPGMSCKWGLTFMINTGETPQGRSPGSLSWAGLANSYYWIDPVKNVTGAILTQILPFYDPEVVPLYAQMETEIYRSMG